MPKNFTQSAEERSIFLVPLESDKEKIRKGEREDTRPIRNARYINIDRIKPDPSLELWNKPP